MGQDTDILYADIILPLAMREPLTYEVPAGLVPDMIPGQRVIVPLGKKKRYTGIVRRVHRKKPSFEGIRQIIRTEGSTPVVTERVLKLWEWMAEYYLCSVGEVMKAAIPSGFVPDSSEPETELLASDQRKKRKLKAKPSEEDREYLALYELSEVQQEAYQAIVSGLSNRGVVLLHGITSSGKTEVYFHLIDEQLRQGKQVLYLVPEIALTTQLIERIDRHFGDTSVVYHSRLTNNQRASVWQRVSGADGVVAANLVLGVRSSLFLPFTALGLIVVDEEHDASYKQQDPAPRYNARDTAIVLAGLHNAKVVLGSATPSIESYYNSSTGKYGLAELPVRHGESLLPEIVIADTRQAAKRKEMVSHFTPVLVDAIDQALAAGEQVILFRNRRGFAPFVQCGSCGWIPQCRSCSVSLTYHRSIGKLKCHYCGFSLMIPSLCESCGSAEIATVGFGTEKIEDELRMVFPDARVGRMDQDTTRGKDGFRNILDDFAAGKTDILIGTQMISKGLDFENLTLVGILHADSLLNYPDFRSYERSFQMMEQVSGRSGRRRKVGKVIIQSGDPGNPVIQMVLNHDYLSMYQSQIEERELFGYPPFTRIIQIYLKHRDKDQLDQLSAAFADNLKKFFSNRVMGPEYPPVSRIQSLYVKSVVIKIEKDKSQIMAKKYILKAIEKLIEKPGAGTLRVNIDVDPL